MDYKPTAYYPLTSLQKGMLYHALSAPGTGVDIEQIVCLLNEPLDIDLFKKAWSTVLDRHTVLRTYFQWIDRDEPRQIISPEVDIELVRHSWENQSFESQKAKLEEFLYQDRLDDFDLSKPPLMRWTVIRLSPTKYYFIWTFHHILLDGRSFPIILKELFNYYEASEKGEVLTLAPPYQYHDFIKWSQKVDFTKAKPFWQKNLEGFSNPTPLALGKPKAHSPSRVMRSCGIERSVLSEKESLRLETFAKENGITVNTLIQSAWSVLLHHYSRQNDIIFGSTRACRYSDLEGVKSIVGLLINTLPIRLKINAQETCRDFLRYVRESNLRLRPYEHTPLPELQKWLGISADKPLFESLVVFENYSLNDAMRSQGSRWISRQFEYRGQTNFPLTLIGYAGPKLNLSLEYDSDRFKRHNVRRTLDHVVNLLLNFVESPEVPIGAVPYMSSEEERSIIERCRPKFLSKPPKKCIHQIFEEQVTKFPDSVVITCGTDFLTYSELNGKANQLANYLKKEGVGPEVLVGVCLDRSVNLIISILGILKAGGAYLPIDSSYPRERLLFMMKDSNASILLTNGKLTTNLPKDEIRAIHLEDIDYSSFEDQVPDSGVDVTNLAYVIYTSGSTGRSKGVMIPHSNVVRLFTSTNHWFKFSERDVWTMFHSYAFDFSVWEMWGALLYGGKLIVVTQEVSRSPEEFYNLLVKEKVTVLNQTPSSFKQIIQVDQAGKQNQKHSLRFIIFGGEALDLSSLRPWMEEYGDSDPQLVNMYGITETTVHVTYRPILKDDLQLGSVIGSQIPDLHLYILDQNLKLVPKGIEGELYVGGPGVARGYLNRPSLNATHFIKNPFPKYRGERLYKTGDLARFLDNNDIEYLGRIDHQVKIRGFRVELGEIESCLIDNEKIEEAIVIASTDAHGDKKLVANLRVNQTDKTDATEIRNYLRQSLPEYMIPSKFVVFDKFPLTSNGKVDRRKLLESGSELVDRRGVQSKGAHTRTQRSISEIWKMALGLDKVGIKDNFFDLGGNSMNAVRVHSQIQQSIAPQLKLLDLYQFPTISSLAGYIDKGTKAENLEKEGMGQHTKRRDLNEKRLKLRRSKVLSRRASKGSK